MSLSCPLTTSHQKPISGQTCYSPDPVLFPVVQEIHSFLKPSERVCFSMTYVGICLHYHSYFFPNLFPYLFFLFCARVLQYLCNIFARVQDLSLSSLLCTFLTVKPARFLQLCLLYAALSFRSWAERHELKGPLACTYFYVRAGAQEQK